MCNPQIVTYAYIHTDCFDDSFDFLIKLSKRSECVRGMHRGCIGKCLQLFITKLLRGSGSMIACLCLALPGVAWLCLAFLALLGSAWLCLAALLFFAFLGFASLLGFVGFSCQHSHAKQSQVSEGFCPGRHL